MGLFIFIIFCNYSHISIYIVIDFLIDAMVSITIKINYFICSFISSVEKKLTNVFKHKNIIFYTFLFFHITYIYSISNHLNMPVAKIIFT